MPRSTVGVIPSGRSSENRQTRQGGSSSANAAAASASRRPLSDQATPKPPPRRRRPATCRRCPCRSPPGPRAWPDRRPSSGPCSRRDCTDAARASADRRRRGRPGASPRRRASSRRSGGRSRRPTRSAACNCRCASPPAPPAAESRRSNSAGSMGKYLKSPRGQSWMRSAGASTRRNRSAAAGPSFRGASSAAQTAHAIAAMEIVSSRKA